RPAFRAARRLLVKIAGNEDRPASERIAALASLAGAPAAELTELRHLLEVRHPLDVQLATSRLLAAADDAVIVQGPFKPWKALSPRVQTTILDIVCGRKDRLTLVLDAIEKRRIEPGALPAARQTQMQENRDPEIRRRAKALLAARPTSDQRKRVLERYRAALT